MSTLTGTGSLIRLALRRDRIILPAWIGVFAIMAYSSAAATGELYASAASRAAAVLSFNSSPAIVALYGRVYSSSVGALSLVKMSSSGAAMLAVLAFMLVVRHTRAEEESGRLELLGATAIGRRAPLTAGFAIGFGASIAIGVLATLGLIAAGLPAAGSVAFGLAWGATGCAFAAVGALTAQLTTGGRTASGIAAGFLGLAYLVRAVGDAAGRDDASWFSWLSPIAWGQQVRPFAQERWPVLLLFVVFTVVASIGAYVLVGRRDLGAGLLADRPGRATAGPSLSHPLGLAWRLQRGTIVAWVASIVLVGAVLGSIASQIGGMLDSPEMKDLIAKLGGTRAITDAYLALMLGIFGVIVSVYGMQAVMRLRSEEIGLRADLLLSTAVSRGRWVASHVSFALGGTAVILLLGGLATGIGHAMQTGDSDAVGRVVAGAAAQLPAVWIMAGLVLAVYGFWPRSTMATWGLLVAFLLLGEFGPVFELPGWLMDLSPFAHTPRIPGGSFEAGPTLALALVAAALLAAGTIGFRRRDLDQS